MAHSDEKNGAPSGPSKEPRVVVMNSLSVVRRNTQYLDEQEKFDREGLFDQETIEYSQLLVK